ncbi:MAG: hypothetical protein ACI9CD_000332 [Candidatus Deianiraeaceae bacterium]|jgi:hypothetical protein
MNVLILMGDIQSLQYQGKPLLLYEYNGQTILQKIVNKHKEIEGNLIFVLQDDTNKTFQKIIKLLAPQSQIVNTAAQTKGALCSSLLAIHHINNNNPLLIVNGLQYLDVNLEDFISHSINYDGGIVTFQSFASGWSYADVSPDGFIQYVAEKDIISHNATAGCYFFKKGTDYIHSAMETIRNNNAVNNIFYLAPCYNEMLLYTKQIISFKIKREQYFYFKRNEDIEHFKTFISTQ